MGSNKTDRWPEVETWYNGNRFMFIPSEGGPIIVPIVEIKMREDTALCLSAPSSPSQRASEPPPTKGSPVARKRIRYYDHPEGKRHDPRPRWHVQQVTHVESGTISYPVLVYDRDGGDHELSANQVADLLNRLDP